MTIVSQNLSVNLQVVAERVGVEPTRTVKSRFVSNEVPSPIG